MCDCKNINFGTFKNSTGLITPQGERKWIDNCILPEILELWYKGIPTIESCCGHNKHTGYIAVYDFDIHKMYAMGYVEESRTDLFYPKSIPITNCT